MATCLVTGASGFLGRNLVSALTHRGDTVIPVPREYLYRTDKLRKLVQDNPPDLIFHFAAYGNRHHQTEDSTTVIANIMGTLHLLTATRDINYKAFINIGSSSEYGTKRTAMKETDSLETDTLYGATKAGATLICRAIAHKYQKPIVTIRPFSVYGPGEAEDKFIPTVIRTFKAQGQLTLSSGVHDWIWIEDFIAGVLVVADHATELAGQAINVGTGIQTSNHGVVGIVREILGQPIRIKYVQQLRDYDTTHSWVADISLIKSLGWRPTVQLEAGLTRLIYGTH